MLTDRKRTLCLQNNSTSVLTLTDLTAMYEPLTDTTMGTTPNYSAVCLANLLSEVPCIIVGGSADSTLTVEDVIAMQTRLQQNNAFLSFTEVEQINLFITRQWLRLLVWEYTMKHFAMSFEPQHPAFSFMFPFILGNETALFLSLVQPKSLSIYGYDLVSERKRTFMHMVVHSSCHFSNR